MTANDSKSYLGYLNKLVVQCNNTYDHSISKSLKKLKKLSWILNLLSLKLMIEPKFLSIGMVLGNFTLKIGQEKYLLSILFWKLALGLVKLKT